MGTAIVANRDRISNLATALAKKKDYLAKVLPKHLTAERVLKVAITAASRTPKLLECSQQSFILAVIQASQLGLEAGSPLGEAYLVPFKTECTLIVGYRGLITLARRSGEIESLEAHVVRVKDRFELTYGLDAKLVHTPFMPPPPADLSERGMAAWQKEADPGPMVAVYAIARLKGGGVQYEVMTRAEVERIRGMSRSGSSGPWVDHFDEMARKTVVRRLAKYLPMSIELANALDHEDRAEKGEAPIDVEALADSMELGDGQAAPQLSAAKPSATDALKDRLREQVPVSNGAAPEGPAEAEAEAREPGAEG